MATFAHRFTEISQQILRYHSQYAQWQLSPSQSMAECKTFRHLGQMVPFSSEGRHACSRRCQLAFDLTLARPLHSPGDCCVVGVVPFLISIVALLGIIYPVILQLFHRVVADRRATGRTTNSHAASRQKKGDSAQLTNTFTVHVAFLIDSINNKGHPCSRKPNEQRVHPTDRSNCLKPRISSFFAAMFVQLLHQKGGRQPLPTQWVASAVPGPSRNLSRNILQSSSFEPSSLVGCLRGPLENPQVLSTFDAKSVPRLW